MSALSPVTLTAAGLTDYLHEKIPLTREMQLVVTECDRERIVVEAPLAPNRNHLGTAFGGSLHAIPTLACYGTLWMLVREAGFDSHVVVKRSHAEYRAPVRGVIRAVCQRPPPGRCAEFAADLRRHGKARMDLTAIIEGENGKPAVDFRGAFVALTKPQ
jgi:thioesterase domain-containing protein